MSPGTSKPQAPEGKISSHDLHSNPSSHLRQRLRGSFGASTVELQHISEVLEQKKAGLVKEIRGHETEIQNLQTKVRRHQATIIELESKLKGLGMCSVALGSLLAPIRRLPVEILKEIFAHFCDKIQIQKKPSIPPLKLAAICSSWRDLVFSTSQLWTRVEVSMQPLSLRRLGRIELLTNLVLDYSGNAPLHLLLVGDSLDRFHPAQQDVVVSVIKSIAQHSHRWCHLTLYLPDNFLREMNPFIKGLPLLESLTASSFVTPFDMVNMAPKLRHVELHSIGKPTDLKLPWHQISSLKINTSFLFLPGLIPDSSKVLLSEFMACLRLCTSLQRLQLESHYPDSWEQAPDSPLTMHNLETLFLGLVKPRDLEQLFSLLTFPQLTSITLSCIADDECAWDVIPIAESFLICSSCTITSLTLRCIPLTDDDLVSLLRHLPSIEELSILQRYHFISDQRTVLHNTTDLLITSLHVPHFGPLNNVLYQPLLPNLRKIDLTMFGGYAPSCEALVALVKSRWLPDPTYAAEIGVVCLKSVTFHFLAKFGYKGGPLGYDFNSLACLWDAGLNFTTSRSKQLM